METGLNLLRSRNLFLFTFLLSLSLASLFYVKDFVVFGLDGMFAKDTAANRLLGGEAEPKLFISIAGAGSASLQKAQRIATELESKPFVSKVYFDLSRAEPQEQRVIGVAQITSDEVQKRLLNYKTSLESALFYTPLDRDDPLSILQRSQKKIPKNIDGYLSLGNSEYLIIAFLAPNTSDNMLAELIATLNDDAAVTAFSPREYFMRNEAGTKRDVSVILTLGLVLLFALYFFALKNAKLLAVHFLVQAVIFALATWLCIGYFGSVHIFTLVFGMSVGSIGIDYLLHHYFGQNYQNKRFNKEVFLGFITTFAGFLSLFLLLDFYILEQIAFYALAAIVLNYMAYGILFFASTIGARSIPKSYGKAFIKPKHAVLLMLALIVVIFAGFREDFSLRSLSLQFDDLDAKASHFGLATAEGIYFYRSDSFKGLLESCEKLRNKTTSFDSFCSKCSAEGKIDLDSLQKTKQTLLESASKLGFDSTYFQGSYNTENIPLADRCTKEAVTYIAGNYYAEALMDQDEARQYSGSLFSPLQIAQENIDSSVSGIAAAFVVALSVALAVVFFAVSKSRMVAFIYLLLPVLCALFAVFVLTDGLNIMHLFALIVVTVISIDFAVYASRVDQGSKASVLYATLTTMLGFGVLVFSSIPALFSIGIVVTSAMLGLLFLNLFLKPSCGA